jgi:hypothetical protein
VIQIYSGLMFLGEDLDPDEITVATGLVPYRARRRGEWMGRTGRRRPRGTWWFVTLDLRDTTDASLDDLFALLEPAWPALIQLGTKWETYIECFVKIYDGPPDGEPWYGFRSRHVRRAAELGASLAIDDYDFRGSDVEPD